MEIDGPMDALNKIFDAAEAGIPGFAHEFMRKGVKHKGLGTGILIKFGLELMRSAIASGIELGNNGLTTEQYKAWWNKYAEEKMREFYEQMPDDVKEIVKDKGMHPDDVLAQNERMKKAEEFWGNAR
jgi:hypothetical protein